MLDLFSSMVAQLPYPLRQEAVDLFVQKILPLHSLKEYGEYSRELIQIISSFIFKKEELLQTTVRYLINHWPVTDRRKEALFIKEYEELMSSRTSSPSPQMIVSFYKRISRSFSDPASSLAKTAIEVMQNATLLPRLRSNVSSLFFTLTLELNNAAKLHWDLEIRELASEALEVMRELDCHSFAVATESLKMSFARKSAIFGVAKTSWGRIVDAARVRDPGLKMPDITDLRQMFSMF
jgi:hypothetical protein